MEETKISIGGKEYPAALYYYKCLDIMKRYNRVYNMKVLQFEHENKRKYDSATDKIFMPDTFFFWAIFYLIESHGKWIFRKPFRNIRKMTKRILKDEAGQIVKFIGDNILYTRTDAEPEPQAQKKS